MANTKILGTKAKLYLAPATAVTGTAPSLTIGTPSASYLCENVKSIDFGIENNPVDVTDNDSSGAWNEFLMGNRTGTFSFTWNWNSSVADGDASEAPISEIVEAEPDLYWAFYFPNGTTNSGDRGYFAQCYIQSVTHNASNEAVQEVSYTFKITGPIYVSTKSAVTFTP